MVFVTVIGKIGHFLTRHLRAVRAVVKSFIRAAGHKATILMQSRFTIGAGKLFHCFPEFLCNFINVTFFLNNVAQTGTTVYSAK